MHKWVIIIGATFLLSACAGVGWWAGKSVLPLKKNPVRIQAKIGDNSYAKNNGGQIAGNDITEIKKAHEVFVTTIPWPVIWLLMVGWPLALIGWMIDPPCEIYRRYKHRHHKKIHMEH